MKVHYSNEPFVEPIHKGIFLAGPTPRTKDVKSWRPEVIDLFEKWGFDGTIVVPERNFEVKCNYDDQVEWERTGLTESKAILFWVPRELFTMPAFTTNVEFGYWLAKSPERCFYGRPDDSCKNRYLDWLYSKETTQSIFNNMEALARYVGHVVNGTQSDWLNKKDLR